MRAELPLSELRQLVDAFDSADGGDLTDLQTRAVMWMSDTVSWDIEPLIASLERIRSALGSVVPPDATSQEIAVLAEARIAPELAVRALVDGVRSDAQVGALLGLTASAVRAIRRKHGIENSSRRPRTGPKAPSGWQGRLKELHTSGATVAGIMAATGWKRKTVENRLFELKLPANRTRGRE